MSESDYPKAYRYRRIVKAKRYLDQHFKEPVRLEEVADEASFSKYHFLRLFKNAYGKTPWQYLTGLRIRHARSLLEDTGRSVSRICYDVGFESVGSFSSLFKQETGYAPSQFREKKKGEQAKTSGQPLSVVPTCFAQRMKVS